MTEISMRERIARALHKSNYESGRKIAPPWPSDRFKQEQWLFMADAVLAAMMEPTGNMIAAGESAASVGIGKPSDDEALPRVWKAMIEAAQRLPIQHIPIVEEVPD